MARFFCAFIFLWISSVACTQSRHSAFVGGSINYKGYQTGLGYAWTKTNHTVQLGVWKNQSVDRLFAQNHLAFGLAYRYRILHSPKFSMGPELDFQRMFLRKVGNRYNDSRILSLAYYVQWNINEHWNLSNSIGTGGYIERFYVKNSQDPQVLNGVGGLIKLQCGYRF